MKCRSILSISAMTMLGLALLPSSIIAQQGTLKQQLVGAWTLASYDATGANGQSYLWQSRMCWLNPQQPRMWLSTILDSGSWIMN